MKSAEQWALFLNTKFMALTARLQALVVFNRTSEAERTTRYREDNLENHRKVEEHAVEILKFLASSLTAETVKNALGEIGFIVVSTEMEKKGAAPTTWYAVTRQDTRTWADRTGALVPHNYKYVVIDRGHLIYFTEYPRLQLSRRGDGEAFWLQEGGFALDGPPVLHTDKLKISDCFLQRA